MILITGPTGTIGRELVKLLARPEEPIRALVHDRQKAASIALPGVEIFEGDLAESAGFDALFQGVHKIFLLTPSIENQIEIERNFIRAADRPEIKHLVKLSALGAAPDSPARFLRAHGEGERFLKNTGLPYTILRPNSFMQNFLNFRDSIIHEGKFYLPMGDGRISFVDVRDIALVAAETLEEHGHAGKEYDVTGGEALSYADTAGKLSFVLGKPVAYVDVPPEAARKGLLEAGIPEWTADGLLELYASWKFNSASEIADTVPRIAKKDPIAFLEFARDYAPQFGRHGRERLSEIMDEVNLDNMTPGA